LRRVRRAGAARPRAPPGRDARRALLRRRRLMRDETFPLLLDGPALFGGVPPAWPFFAAALLVALLRGREHHAIRRAILVATPLVGLANLVTLAPGASWSFAVLALELVQLRADRLSLLFGLLFHIGALLGGIYALRVRDRLQQAAALAYAGSALGAVFAGDLVT